MIKTETDIIVRSTEIDGLGHVNNAKYLEYLEWGRIDWYDEAAKDHFDPERFGLQTVVVSITINFRKECRQGDRLTVVTQPEKVGGKSFVLKQEIVRRDSGEVCADATITSVLMDKTSRRSVEVPDGFRTLFA